MNSLIRKASVITICAAALALVSGCGNGGDSVVRSAPAIDACALLTAADAGEILGGSAAQPAGYTKMDRVDEQGGNALTNCLYEREGSFQTLSVVVTYRSVEFPDSFAALRAESEGDGGQMAEMALELLDASEPVEGLGDFGYWTAEMGTLTVYADRHYVIAISADGASSGDSAGARARATEAARRILSRL